METLTNSRLLGSQGEELFKPTNDAVNITVIIALPEEHDIFLERFPSRGDVSTRELVRLTHDLGIRGYTLTSVLCEGMGSDCAASAAYSAAESLSPDLIVCLGIAGGLSDDCNLGDVCISNEIVDILHNTKVRDTGSSSGSTRSELSPRNYPVDTGLQASCRFVRSHPNLRPHFSAWTRECSARLQAVVSGLGQPDLTGLESGSETNFHVGPIVCGPVSISKFLSKQLRDLNRKTLAIETESGGAFRVCQEKGIPAITIRGIADRADPNKRSLESLSKKALRNLAMQNAVAFFDLLTRNVSFMNVATQHGANRRSGVSLAPAPPGPSDFLSQVERQIDQTLEASSAEYKNRPNDAPLPLPRVQKLVLDDEVAPDVDEGPLTFFDAINAEKAIFVKIPRSYPEKTIAWSVAKALLKNEIDGKQVLPVVYEAAKISRSSGGIARISGIDVLSGDVCENFSPVLIVNEPPFESRSKMQMLISDIKRHKGLFPIVVLSQAETPLEAIDLLKSQLGLSDFLTTSMPFSEIAAYLEQAFEMAPGEADVAATRLQETFSKFRLNTHPAYFIGLQESTLGALINANHRAELIELAVSGILSFIVAADRSRVKLSRTTREEFLRDLAYEIRVEKRTFSQAALATYVEVFSTKKALEVEPMAFLRGFFEIGLLNDVAGEVRFSLPYVEAFLLSDKLKSLPSAARSYFNPDNYDFDGYTFDLYCERGAAPEVIGGVLEFARGALDLCDDELNVFSAKAVRPAALATPETLVSVARSMGNAVQTMTSEASTEEVRLEKQRLIDAREAVRKRVGARRPDRSSLSATDREAFERLDRLSQSCSLLATLIGSGAERLTGDVKRVVSQELLVCSERFLHYWTKKRTLFDFDELRRELMSDESVDEIIEQFELFDEDRDKVRDSLSIFIADQELKSLSSPLATVLHRLSSYAGVRSLKPIVNELRPQNEIEALLKGAWYMEVETDSGKKVLKGALRNYRGSPLFRFVLANHFMWRVFWNHWQHSSRSIFMEAARNALKPLGLIPKDEERQLISGPFARSKK